MHVVFPRHYIRANQQDLRLGDWPDSIPIRLEYCPGHSPGGSLVGLQWAGGTSLATGADQPDLSFFYYKSDSSTFCPLVSQLPPDQEYLPIAPVTQVRFLPLDKTSRSVSSKHGLQPPRTVLHCWCQARVSCSLHCIARMPRLSLCPQSSELWAVRTKLSSPAPTPSSAACALHAVTPRLTIPSPLLQRRAHWQDHQSRQV